MLSGDRDGRVIVWDTSSGIALTTVEIDAPVTSATISGTHHYIGDDRGRIFQANLLPPG